MEAKVMAREGYSPRSISKFAILNLFGCIIFFVPITINGTKTIPLDPMLTAVQTVWPRFGPAFAPAMIIIGGLYPFFAKAWKKDSITGVLSVLQLLGIAAGFMVFGMRGPEWLLRDDILPFIFTKVAVPVSIIVPLGSFFLTFLTGYGLLEFIGVFMRPLIRSLWKLPGNGRRNRERPAPVKIHHRRYVCIDLAVFHRIHSMHSGHRCPVLDSRPHPDNGGTSGFNSSYRRAAGALMF